MSRLAVLALCVAPMAAWSHTDVMDAGRARVPTPSARPTSSTTSDNLWTCWLDGAPLQSLPLPAPKAVARVAHAGQVFAAETVEVTPFGTQWLRLKSGASGNPFWVSLAYCRRVAPDNAIGGDLPIGRERLGPYEGLPADYRPSDLLRVAQRYCYSDEPQRLRAEAADACVRMLDAARREAGLTIRILSAYRSAQTQAYLCRQKIVSDGVEQRAVARPGHSEHQLGTTVDLVGENGRDLLNERFVRTREGQWLRYNCGRFGFVRTYSNRRALHDGIAYEPWHFRYVGRANVQRFRNDDDE